MRLRFLDRLRRLTRRRPAMDAVPPASEPHGRHRRAHRQSAGPPAESRVGAAESAGPPAAAGWPAPGESLAPLPPPASPPPDGSPVAETSLAPRTPAVRAGSARARIREAPQDAVGFGEVARPAPAAPSPRTHWHEAARAGRRTPPRRA